MLKGVNTVGKEKAKMQIDKILKTIIDNLVEDKDAVSIESKEENGRVDLSVKVNKKDMGRIIGKQGKTANSIRTLMKSIGSKEGKKVFVEFIG